jgi:endoglucanase
VGSVPPHLQKKDKSAAAKEALPIAESFIDLGLPADEVAAQVAVGDPVTFAIEAWENNTALFGKALDDRVGLYIMISAAARVKEADCDLYLIASAQEEYGLRGAGPAVFGTEPQIVLALEGTVASDTPGLKLPANALSVTQGKGPEIRITDNRMISHRGLADFLVQTARKGNIPHQVIVKNTGATDAAVGQITAAGVKACAVSVPVRYIHAPIGMARKSDIDHTIDLVAGFLSAPPVDFPNN